MKKIKANWKGHCALMIWKSRNLDVKRICQSLLKMYEKNDKLCMKTAKLKEEYVTQGIVVISRDAYTSNVDEK